MSCLLLSAIAKLMRGNIFLDIIYLLNSRHMFRDIFTRQFQQQKQGVHAVKWALQEQTTVLWRLARGATAGGVLLWIKICTTFFSHSLRSDTLCLLLWLFHPQIPIYTIARRCFHETVGQCFFIFWKHTCEPVKHIWCTFFFSKLLAWCLWNLGHTSYL